MLDAIRLSFSCNELWERMRGNEQARFCERCQKTVYNLSAMTTAEAEATLCGPGDPPCVRYMRMADGRVSTKDRVLPRVALTAGLAAAAAGAAVILGDQPEPRPACAEPASQVMTVESQAKGALIPEVGASPPAAIRPEVETTPEPVLQMMTGGIRPRTYEMGDVAPPLGRVRRQE